MLCLIKIQIDQLKLLDIYYSDIGLVFNYLILLNFHFKFGLLNGTLDLERTRWQRDILVRDKIIMTGRSERYIGEFLSNWKQNFVN